MSRIKHLEIRGIRSFDPNDSQTMSFYTPLTIIVGKNGCGKTTLIECLKYATTGELPPNSKQGAFINDPKLSSSSKVKAQVRLTFYNIKGKRMQVVRGMELTQNKASKTQKTTQSTLMCIDDAKERSLTSTCSELDTEMPLHLGVSKAILENVIFCHQEESYWPLSEPAVLKKKFDEIFAATRYTKALENIKSLKKDKTGDLKVQENELLHLKNSFLKSSKVKDTKNQVHSLMIETEFRIATLDGGEIEGLVEQMTGLMDQNQKFQKLMSDQKSLRLEKDILVKNLKDLQDNLELYEESEEDLQKLLQDYRKSLQEEKNNQDKLEMQRDDISQDLAMLESSLSTHCTLKGTYQAQLDAYQKHVNDLQVIMKSLSETHGFSISITALDPLQYSMNVKEQLDMKLESLSSEIHDWKNSMKVAENELSDQFQSINSKLSSHLERKFMYETQINSLKLKINGIMDELEHSSISKGDIENLMKELKNDELEMEDLKSSFKLHELETKLRSLSADLQSKEFLLSEINEEISSLSKHADSRARLGIKLADRESKKTNIESLKAILDSTWKKADGTKKIKIDMASIESEIKNELRQKELALKAARDSEKNHEREISGLSSKFQMISKSIETKKGQIEDRLTRIRNVCGSDNYPEARENAEKEYDEAQESFSSISSAGKLYKNFISKFESSRCCPICVRSYDNAQEEEKFMQRLVSILNKIPEAIQNNQDQLAESEKRRNQLRQLQSSWDDFERMSKLELPEFSSQLQAVTDERSKQASALEDIASEIAALEAEVLALSDSLKSCQELTKLNSEMVQLESEIQSIERTLSISGSTKTMTQIQKEHEEAQGHCQSIRKEIDRVNKEIRQKNHDIQEKEFAIRDKREKLRILEQKWNERERKVEAAEDLRAEIHKMEIEIKTQENLAADVRPSLEEKEREIAAFREKLATEESIKVKQLNDLQRSLNQTSGLMSDIQSFIDEDGSKRLENCVQEISNLGAEIKAAKLSLEEIASKIDRMNKQRSEIQVLQRTIDDNLKYRQMIRERVTLDSRLDTLNLQISEFDTESIEMQYNKLKQIHAKLVGERAGLVGELKQLQEQEKRIDMELATDYKDVENLYRKQLIMVKTERMAHNDLEKYGKALDAYACFTNIRAIVRFHGLKLKEINDIIKELWVKTYRGNDIETIEIRSDMDTTRGNRSYNYRVVMIKNNAELDMRGRCSAGQKVLASIIIRLALAETFCLNCGILALDEPTTNLDIANMESLAESLANIIDARKDQKNFQLIVITHDEKFMEMLGRSEHADYIWRVSKDEEGFSNLTRETIAHYI